MISMRKITSNLMNSLNENLAEYSPMTLVVGTFATTLALQKAYAIYQHWDTKQIKRNLADNSIELLKHLPYIGQQVQSKMDSEVNSLLSEMKADIEKIRAEWNLVDKIPEEGLSEEEIRKRFENLQSHYKAGRLSGAVYAEYDQKFSELLQHVWSKTALTNPMHPEWPLINLMEAEIISICQDLLHGLPGAPGMLTHGGSTSILEACKAYVLYARENGIQEPEIIVPESVHVAFDKAAQILNCKLVKIPVDETTGAADVTAMEQAITKRTCMMVGSAPSFPFGVIDPIPALAAIAKKHLVPLHVDSCLGGFLTAFAQQAGLDIPPCDFSVLGVTSISIDTHKYGQTPKGTSVLLWRHDCPATPTQVYPDWPGGMYATPGIDGSRSGADVATAWTVLCHKGKKQYIEETKAILELKEQLVDAIKKIKGIYIPYAPQLSVIAIRGKKGINPLLIADRLKQAGWSVNILQTPDQKAIGFHFCLTIVHTQQPEFLTSFIQDLSRATQYTINHPKEKPKGIVKVYGKLGKWISPCVQKRIGEEYIKIRHTLPGTSIKSSQDSDSTHSNNQESRPLAR